MLATLPHDGTRIWAGPEGPREGIADRSLSADRRSVLTGAVLLVAVLVVYFTLGHLPSVWERAFAWWFGLWGAPVTVPACPYPSCGYWIPR